MMTSCKQIEVQAESDETPQKWCVSLREDVFKSFILQGTSNPTVHKVFGEGSLFSPMLFGKFFDPSDAFPLWEFESDILLSNLRNSGQCNVDWSQTDQDYILKAEIPGIGKNSSVQICVENGKVVEISGQWRHQKEGKAKEWRSGHWWEDGFVRRLELPEDADWGKMEAHLNNNDMFLEIRIPKNHHLDSDIQGNYVTAQDA